jgi:hypothetical protein
MSTAYEIVETIAAHRSTKVDRLIAALAQICPGITSPVSAVSVLARTALVADLERFTDAQWETLRAAAQVRPGTDGRPVSVATQAELLRRLAPPGTRRPVAVPHAAVPAVPVELTSLPATTRRAVRAARGAA